MMYRISLITTYVFLTLAHAQVTTPSICQSPEFQAAQFNPLGFSPITIRTLVNGTQVCFEFALASSAPSGTSWFAVGISPEGKMVNSPSNNVMLYQQSIGKPESYVIGGYSNSDFTQEPNQAFFAIDSTSSASMSFRYQRTLAAGTENDVAIDPTKSYTFIWAHGTSWPISGHKSGTKGTAKYSFTGGNVASGSTFCVDKNCPAIIGGITLAVMLVSGVLVAGCFRNTDFGRTLLHKTLVPPSIKSTTNAPIGSPITLFYQNIADLKIGEAFIILMFIAAIIILASLVYGSGNNATSTTGQVTLLVIMFLLLPVSRIPLWTIVYGSSFERIVKFHRWMGMCVFIVTVIHLIYALQQDVDVFSTYETGEVIPLFGSIAFISFFIILLTANEYVRRTFYEVFYFSHRIFATVGLIAMILHSPKFIGIALAVPLAFYVLSMLRGWIQGYSTTYHAKASVHEGTNVTTLILSPTDKIKTFAKTMEFCSYFWINVPTVSGLEWHPFSAIASPDEDTIGFAIRAMGKSNNAFTAKLLAHATSNTEIELRILGPFGKLSIDVDQYDVVVLIGGGVGITPLLSAINQRFRGVTKTGKAAQWNILWSVRHPNDLLMAEKLMPSSGHNRSSIGNLQDASVPTLGNGSFSVTWSCHCSMANQDGAVVRPRGDSINYRAGVPVLDEYINSSRYMNLKVGVLACGPPTMVVEAQALARQCGFDFHKEVFNW